jgi:cytochrome P450
MDTNEADRLYQAYLRAPAEKQPQLLQRLRLRATSFRTSTGEWILTSYEDCKAVLVDHASFGTDWPRSMRALGIQGWRDHPSLRRISGLLMSTSPPAHTRLRHLLGDTLSPAGLERVSATLVRTAADLVVDGHGPDPIGRLAERLPLHAVGAITGISAVDLPRVAQLIRRLNATLTLPVSRGRLSSADRAVAELDRLLERRLHERAATPGDDLLSSLLTAQHEGLLDHEELLSLATTVLGGGLDTASPLLLRGLELLTADPELHSRVRASRQAETSLFNELVRLVSPVRRIPRTALHHRQVGSIALSQGERMSLLVSAANRDPQVYPSPNTIQPRRRGPRPLSFGGGVHACPGATLARSLFSAALVAIHRRRA